MERIVLRTDAELAGPEASDASVAAIPFAGRVTVVFPATRAEYEQAKRDRGTDGPAFVATTGTQRCAWSLPDLTTVDTNGRGPAVPVVVPADAVRALLDGAVSGSDTGREAVAPEADPEGEEGVGARESSAPVVNLKEGRGSVPPATRQAFDDVSRGPQLDAIRGKLDSALGRLERTVQPVVERSHRDLAALSRRSVPYRRESETRDADPVDAEERAAARAWPLLRLLHKARRALEPFCFEALMASASQPLNLRRLADARDLEEVDADRLDDTVEEVCAAFPALEDAVSRFLDRIRGLVERRLDLKQNTAWDADSLKTLQSLAQDFDALCKSLDDTEALEGELSSVRDDLADVEKHWNSAGSLATETRAMLARIQATDLPVPVLDNALHELRRSLTATYDSAGLMLDRLRLLVGLPWSRRAVEGVDLARAIADLEKSHAGCRRVKDRIRRFLAVRALHRTTWTVERSGPADPCGSAIVVRRPPSAAPAPILCFAGPPGCGKTSLAKVIAQAVGRPCVVVPLGGAWDESHLRGLPLSFRTPHAGLIARGLAEAGVRNPVVILDEIDKVGGRTPNVGDLSAALLEVLDPAQNSAFVDHYVGLPVDLSEVLWIGTANSLEAMAPPLRDRMDVIEVPGYTDDEKVAIVKRHLDRLIDGSGLAAGSFWNAAPQTSSDVEVANTESDLEPGSPPARSSGLSPFQSPRPVEMTDDAIRAVICGHTCEAGVRELLRLVGVVCEEVASRRVTSGDPSPVLVVAHEGERPGASAFHRLTVSEILGPTQRDELPRDVRDVVARALNRVTALPRADPEAVPTFEWIKVLTDLPWSSRPVLDDRLDPRVELDRLHVGCDRQKERLLDHMVVDAVPRSSAWRGTLPCLTGAPGVGKTALARSLAAAFGRAFVEISLAGVRHAAAVRGIARPAPDAVPGRIVAGLRQGGVAPERKSLAPVVLLDRLDEMIAGSAVDALLDALDPDRSTAFRDHYVGVPIDLSGVTWLATATDPERIPGVLRDRVHPVSLYGYCEKEKLRIALDHVLPRVLERHGLTAGQLSFSREAVRCLIRDYTREAGVKHLGHLVAAFAQRARRLGREADAWPGEVGPEEVEAALSAPRFPSDEFSDRTRRPGVALALTVTCLGGAVAPVEARCLPGAGSVTFTGTVGLAMRESAAVALTWVREHASRLAAFDVQFDSIDLHLHLPGHRRKDGASAGAGIVTALVSLLTRKPMRPGVAVTGELTLSGEILPVGGIEQKLLAAERWGMAAVVVPEANRPNVMAVSDELRREITIRYAATVGDLLNMVLPDALCK